MPQGRGNRPRRFGRTEGVSRPGCHDLRRYKTNDSTVEKLGELLRENPAGLLVLRDELVGLIATWSSEGREGERASSWRRGTAIRVSIRTASGAGTSASRTCARSIFGGIQPDKLTVYLEQAAHALANDGMPQRFQLLVYPDARRWEWRDRAPDKAARDAALAVFEALADFDPVAWGAASADDFAKFSHFRFSEEAQAVFIEWSGDMHRARIPNEDQPIIRQHLAKFDKLFPALALVFHLVDCAAQGIRGPVSKEAALRAAAWCEYLEAHARRCYGLLKDDGLRAAQALAAKLECEKLEDGFTLRDVRRNQWRSLTTDDAIHAALDWLEDEDLAAQRGHRRRRPRQRAPHTALPHPSRDQRQAQRGRRMNWLERARREIPKNARRRTANSAERTLTAVMAVPLRPSREIGGLYRQQRQYLAVALAGIRIRAGSLRRTRSDHGI